MSVWSTLLHAGATKKLLKQVNEEHGINVDEIVVTFPIQSGSEVCVTHTHLQASCLICSLDTLLDSRYCVVTDRASNRLA